MSNEGAFNFNPADLPAYSSYRTDSRRSVVFSESARAPRLRLTIDSGTKGIATCSQPLASAAGLKILQAGGNAADAATAMAAALNVTEVRQQVVRLLLTSMKPGNTGSSHRSRLRR